MNYSAKHAHPWNKLGEQWIRFDAESRRFCPVSSCSYAIRPHSGSFFHSHEVYAMLICALWAISA